MDWQNVLKRRIENEVQYNNASPEERIDYHRELYNSYYARIKMLRQSIKNLDNTDPNAPILRELNENVNMARFHGRQISRLTRNYSTPDVFSPELEQELRIIKPQTTDRGNRNPRPDLTLEEYQKLDKKQKRYYHLEKLRNSSNDEERKFHQRMRTRLRRNSKQPTFPTPDLGGESVEGITETKEEYDNMSRENKIRFHGKLATRFTRNNNQELSRFHTKMMGRLIHNRPLPVFYSPEHEEEE